MKIAPFGSFYFIQCFFRDGPNWWETQYHRLCNSKHKSTITAEHRKENIWETKRKSEIEEREKSWILCLIQRPKRTVLLKTKQASVLSETTRLLFCFFMFGLILYRHSGFGLLLHRRRTVFNTNSVIIIIFYFYGLLSLGIK